MVGPLAITTKAPGSGDVMQGLYDELVDETRRALQRRLRSSPASDILSPFFMRGKMLRARLVFAAAGAVGGNPEDIIAGAEAIELLHGASLLHDDIIDQASQRRGLVSVHKQLGIERTLVLGDELLLMAFSAVADSQAQCSTSRVLGAIDVLAACARKCCRGQFDELDAARGITEDEYLAIVRGKTAAQFVAASSVGAVLTGGSRRKLERLQIYAEQLGIAFQIEDDILDIFGDSDLMGKPTGNSLALGRPLLPLIYLRNADPELARVAVAHLGGQGQGADKLKRALDRHNILRLVRRTQRSYVTAAIEAIDALEPCPSVDAMRKLALLATESQGAQAIEATSDALRS